MSGPVFQIPGVVIEKRELKSKTNETWRGYILKVATLGATFEINCTPEQWASQHESKEVLVKGRIEDQKGMIRLVAVEIVDAGKKAAA